MKKPQQSEFQKKAQEAEVGADGSANLDLDSLFSGGGMGGAGMEDLQKMLTDSFQDPEIRKQMEDSMGKDFLDVFDKIQNMSPEELQKQMEDAMKLLTGDDAMIDQILEKREEVIEQLEKTKAVPAEELEKFKADPKYFELKMRESFEQMQNVLGDPDYLKMATDAMSAMGQAKGLMGGLGDSSELANLLKENLNDDDKLEEARLEVLKGDNPLLSKLFESEEMQAVVRDPVKWKETVKEGYKDLVKEE